MVIYNINDFRTAEAEKAPGSVDEKPAYEGEDVVLKLPFSRTAYAALLRQRVLDNDPTLTQWRVRRRGER